MKELEDRYREREQQWQQTQSYVDAVKATPDIGKSFVKEECPSEIEAGILRYSDSVNRQISQGSSLSKGSDSTNTIRSRKREFRTNDENNFVMSSSSLHDRKVTRKSDPPKIVRSVRPTPRPATANNQAPVSHKRASTSRDQVQGIRERETKKKIWSR